MLLGCAVSVVVWLWPQRSLIQREPRRVRDAGS
jgi:cytochrome c oxidase subunit 1/cytochrome c oxidase subunit I+III